MERQREDDAQIFHAANPDHEVEMTLLQDRHSNAVKNTTGYRESLDLIKEKLASKCLMCTLLLENLLPLEKS